MDTISNESPCTTAKSENPFADADKFSKRSLPVAGYLAANALQPPNHFVIAV